MVIITGDIEITTPKIGKVKRLAYHWVPDSYKAITVIDKVNPLGFHLPHKHVIGEVHVKSEAKTIMDTYVKSDAANVKLASLIASQKDENGKLWIYTFTTVYFLNESLTVDDGKDVITVYPFVAVKEETTVET